MSEGSIWRQLKQTCTYWSESTFDKYGDPSFGSPAHFSCRFEHKTERFIDAKGDETQSRAIVYTLTAIAVGGYLYLGASSTTNPETVSGADQIRRVDATPGIRAQTTLYKAYL